MKMIIVKLSGNKPKWVIYEVVAEHEDNFTFRRLGESFLFHSEINYRKVIKTTGGRITQFWSNKYISIIEHPITLEDLLKLPR